MNKLFGTLLLLFSFAQLMSCESISMNNRKPNIILIMADDFGYECVGANGGTSYKTPVIDNLAEQGIRFTHCYSQPVCTPSRVKLMTGIYNVRNYIEFGILDANQTTFANLLKGDGYATCVVGKWQLSADVNAPQHFGFDESCLWQHTRKYTKEINGKSYDTRFVNPQLEINGKNVNYTNGEYGPDVVCDYAIDFMEKNKDKPFFVYYPMILTHCPFVPTPDSKDWDPQSIGSETYKGNAKYFGDMTYYMDKLIGKIVNKVRELGLEENTLILFTGDNGTDEPVVSMMGDRKVIGGKGRMDNTGNHVPFIAYWKGTIKPGQVSEELVDFSDFLPSICDAAGTPVPQKLNVDGQSFLPLLKGQKEPSRKWVYIWYSRSGKLDESKAFARNQRYKLYASGQLYDVKKDVMEKNPLSDAQMTKEEKTIKSMLLQVHNKYKNSRDSN